MPSNSPGPAPYPPRGPGAPPEPFRPAAEVRPHPDLMRYYTVQSLFGLIAFPIILLERTLRFRTLRYAFDDEGVRLSVGVFIKRETYVAYRRIQDIHVTRGVLQRWFGLATVAVQTASGSATPELTIEGIKDYDGLRDYLYARMRGAKGLDSAHERSHGAERIGGGHASPAPHEADEALALLRAIRDELAAARQSSTNRGAP